MNPAPPDTMNRVRKIALIAGLAALIPSLPGGYFMPSQFFPAYLIAFLFFWMLALGSLAISLLHYITGGGWGLAIRRPLEAAYGTLPLVAVLFVPILFNLPVLYLWARPEAVDGDVILQQKSPYLNVTFFQIRAVVYFAIWALLGTWVSYLSGGPARFNDLRRSYYLERTGGPGLILWGLTVTFAAIDWGMSLEPHWFSSVYGVLFMAAQAVAATAFAIIIVILLRSDASMSNILTTSRMHDLGSFLLAFTLFWSYINLTQFLVIWSGNLPEETPWYISRGNRGWQFLAILLIILHFLVPFLLLLSRTTKRNAMRLVTVAALLLTMRLVDLYWLVMPAFAPDGLVVNLFVPVTFVLIGGFWLADFTRNLTLRLALPSQELFAAETEDHHELDGTVGH